MRKSEWSDKQLEELLRNMPKIEDHRDPRDIYQNITLKLNKKKQRSWMIPSLATAAAILLFAVLTPNLISWNESAEQSMDNGTSESTQDMEMATIDESQQEVVEEDASSMKMAENENAEEIGITSFDAEEHYTALYDIDLMNENAFTFTIPDVQVQNAVPVTIIVPNEGQKTKLEQLNETMPLLKEEEWGLSEYYPLNADLALDEKENTLKVNVPSGHYYGDGGSAEIAFINGIKDMAKTLGVNSITLYTDDKPGIDLGNHGTLTEIDLSDDSNYAYYLYYPESRPDKPYLVPYAQGFADIDAALNAMRENIDTHGLKGAISKDLDIEEIIATGEDVLTIQLNENSILPNEQNMIYTIEAILLTAKEFDFEKVKLEYNKLDRIGKFIFNEELEVPIAPNVIEFVN